MTFRRKVVVLGSIAGALLLAFVLGEIFSPARVSKASSDALLFPGFKEDAASKIELESAGSKVTLTRSGDWALDIGGAPFPASGSKVSFLLKEIAGLSRGNLVSRSPDAAANLGVSGAQAVHLTITGAKGEVIGELYAGKASPTGKGRYLRAGASAEIYETGDALSPYLSVEKRFWENLRVFPEDLKAEAIVRLSLKSDLQLSSNAKAQAIDYTLSRGQNSQGKPSWSLVGKTGVEVPEERVRNLLEALVSFEGNDFDTSMEAVRRVTSNPRASVTITGAGNAELTLAIGGKMEGDQYPCALMNGKLSYLAPQWRVEQILVTPESLGLPTR